MVRQQMQRAKAHSVAQKQKYVLKPAAAPVVAVETRPPAAARIEMVQVQSQAVAVQQQQQLEEKSVVLSEEKRSTVEPVLSVERQEVQRAVYATEQDSRSSHSHSSDSSDVARRMTTPGVCIPLLTRAW